MPSAGSGSETTHQLGGYTVTVPTGFGPRLLGLRPDGGPEIFVRLGPEVALDAGEAGAFRSRGGHRLWVSPEVPEVTYAPDDHPCDVGSEEGTLRVSAPSDPAGFVKSMEVRADGDGLVVDHRLVWTGSDVVRGGPWAITQLPLGGTAILPLGGRSDNEYQADRALAMWPYTGLTDERLEFRAGAVLIHAAAGSRFKLGSGPAPGRVGYLRDGWLFTKTIEPAGEGEYADVGAVGQVFANDRFCELESLGPLREMSPGMEVRHREEWRVEQCPDLDTAVTRTA